MSVLERGCVLLLFSAVSCGALCAVGKLAHYFLFGAGWRALKDWLAGQPNAVDVAAAVAVVIVLLSWRGKRG